MNELVEKALISTLLRQPSLPRVTILQYNNQEQRSSAFTHVQQLCQTQRCELVVPKDLNDDGTVTVDYLNAPKSRLWIVAEHHPDRASPLRDAAVATHKNSHEDFCGDYRFIIFCRADLLHSVPQTVMHMTDENSDGSVEVFDLSAGEVVVTKSKELLPVYAEVEDVLPAVAILQEVVFASEPTLTVLKYNKAIHGEGSSFIRNLRDPIKYNLVINTLDLTGSRAGGDIGPALKTILHVNRKINTLLLEESSLSFVDVEKLVEVIPQSNVKRVCLSHNPSMDDRSLVAIAGMLQNPASSLTAVDLSFNNALYRQDKKWNTESVRQLFTALGENNKLTAVNISNCGLLEDDIKAAAELWLAKNDVVEDVNLHGNYAGDAAMALVFQSVRKIKKLDVGHTGMTAPGFKAVAEFLGKNPPLQWLCIGSNNSSMNAEGGELSCEGPLALVEALGTNTNLHHLDVSRTYFGDEATIKLCHFLITAESGISSVDIAHNCNVDEPSAHKLKELLSGGFYEGQQPKNKLRSLSVAGTSTSIGERVLLAFDRNYDLEELNISDMSINDAMFSALADAAKLNPRLPLKRLDCSRNLFLKDGINAIANVITLCNHLVYINLANTWQAFTDDIGKATSLSKTKGDGVYLMKPLLLALGIPNAQLNLPGTGLPPLTAKAASGGVSVDFFGKTTLPSLRELDMSSNDISNTLAKSFSLAIEGNTTFLRLWLFDNPIDDVTAANLDPRCFSKR